MKLLLFSILLALATLSYGQSFEGTLTYLNDIELSESMVKMGITKKALIDKMTSEGWSDTIEISYKQGDYFKMVKGNPRSWTIYKMDKNKLYSMRNGEDSEICTVMEAILNVELVEKPEVVKLDTTVVVNGISCSIVRIKSLAGNYDYYYNSSKFEVNPALFSKHTHDYFADFLKISKSLPIRTSSTVNGMMTVTMTLVKSKVGKVDAKLFVIPTLIADKELDLLGLNNIEVMRIKK